MRQITEPNFPYPVRPTLEQIEAANAQLPEGYRMQESEDGWFPVRVAGPGLMQWERDEYFADPAVPDILKHIAALQGVFHDARDVIVESDRVMVRFPGGGYFGLPRFTHTPGGHPIYQHNTHYGTVFAVRDGLPITDWAMQNMDAARNDRMHDGRSLATWVHGRLMPGNTRYTDDKTGAYIGDDAAPWTPVEAPRLWEKKEVSDND